MDKITFEQYIKNPNQTKTRVAGEELLVKNMYTDKFDKLLLKTAGKIDTVLMKKSDKEYFMCLKIPSERVDNVFYDVIIEFYTDKTPETMVNNLNGYFIKVFSNDPKFIFTYAYAFNKRGFLIDDLKSKIGNTPLNVRAKVTNPKNLNGYVKSLYFAYLWFKLKGLNMKLIWNVDGIPYNKNLLLSNIMHASDKLTQVQQAYYIQKHSKNKKSNIGNINNLPLLNNNYKQLKTISSVTKKSNIVAKTNISKMSKTTKKTMKRR